MRVQNSTLILGGRGWARQGKGISISTMQKGAILWKCVNTFAPHCRTVYYGPVDESITFKKPSEQRIETTSVWKGF